jgi:cob(I)alamin adenosyltransferase
MRIYTRTGDDGTTGLIGGKRLPKSALRIEAYGTLDELNASIGLSLTSTILPSQQAILALLKPVQNELFAIGSHLATPVESPYRASLPPIEPQWITRLEGEIDTAENLLPPLKNFILPGGTAFAAHLHLARTVARRAERLVVALAAETEVEPAVLTYLNRLSDWLFVQARHANFVAGETDIPWLPNTKPAVGTVS